MIYIVVKKNASFQFCSYSYLLDAKAAFLFDPFLINVSPFVGETLVTKTLKISENYASTLLASTLIVSLNVFVKNL